MRDACNLSTSAHDSWQWCSRSSVRDGQCPLFFYSREDGRIQVQVAHPAGEAKFWVRPSVDSARNPGSSGVPLRQAQAVVEAPLREIEDAWNRHFGG